MSPTATAARAAADPSQVVCYRENGFAIARGLFSAEEVAALRDTFTDLGRNGPVKDLSDGGGGPSDDPLTHWPRMMHPHRHTHQPWGRLALERTLDPRVAAWLVRLTGEEHLAAQSMLYFKPPGARGQALHQDNYYLRVSPGSCVAGWLALDDCDEENGTLCVVPGSHRLDIRCPEKADPTVSFSGDLVVPPEGMREERIDLKAGDMLFFHGALIHGSYHNRSADRFRRAFICHYLPATSAEVSHWYRPIHDFSGREIAVAGATGGGACGGPEAKGPH
ncbi:MAG TPA: phytanoyl-CoA dioxygenase family protein [Planctomycetota bacterium]|nr:phytanoyl-CoA dioxygenase family protein [Planctomycetota bacterium]